MSGLDGAQLWLVRHGETEWSASGRHTSRTDLPLTPTGEAQAIAIGRMLAGDGPDAASAYVLSSPMHRARETARLAGLTVDEIDDDLREWDYGEYEGRTSAGIRAERPDWELWTDGAPGGEQPPDVAARADRVLNRARELLPDHPVVVVAHGHICRMIGGRWIGLGPSGGRHLLLATAAPSLLSEQYGVPVIDRWNLRTPSLRAHPDSATANRNPGD